ncbi:EKC/KEOPS complex subunit TP53RK [Leptopilina heterotoma]|uniref:EKC/KEOPS complex subunit TP53RK n=1 Tax=Leptopilina heterotoma TaxID=63436 RepID=UPI001CA91461|nr:EKC/KEOPS complex subunit TP53RK [Leptopilina heterotoma]XP_043463118.1 EKC/KEOPS complex subunit TP53RK [Leptopilina heterotoma]XP_043463119.1 EKC/KEOPS complex subunit TP53RK [Leptopilina heterotoma]
MTEAFENYELIAQGAEARLYKGTYLNRPVLIKHRFVKKYRHEILDKSLVNHQIKSEARALSRATAAGVLTPALYHVDLHRRNIYMEYLNNTMTVKKFIDENISEDESFWQVARSIAKVLGNLVGKLHSENIFHGDLTTSNILLRDVTNESRDVKKDQVILIDFGLAHVNCSVEDSAVDLYVLERSLKSAHSKLKDLIFTILEGYLENYVEKKQEERGKQVLNKLKEVRSRGRRRVMIG